jgi:hypothetical protein
MTTLMIKDLSLTAELDRKAMAAVHGGRVARPSLSLFDLDLRYTDDHSVKSNIAASIVQGQTIQNSFANGNDFAFVDKFAPKMEVKTSQSASINNYVG